MDPEDRFRVLVDELAGSPGVTTPGKPGQRGFGSSALKVNGAIFAMLSRGQLVVKLSQSRVESLIGEGTGGPFDAARGRPMKEWVAITPMASLDTWRSVAREALAFVSAARRYP